MEPFLQIAPHSLAIVLSRVVAEDAPGVTESEEPPHHHTGYEIFADFKTLNMKYFWNKMVADAIAETFFLGWIDEHVLLIQGKEDHLEVLREAWMRRSLKPPHGFDIKYLVDINGGDLVWDEEPSQAEKYHSVVFHAVVRSHSPHPLSMDQTPAVPAVHRDAVCTAPSADAVLIRFIKGFAD
ncbi:hypothetical protein DNTS_031591 [Danionella cerebrum]|uniref:Storkhead-box protein 1 n=1 Tax=Danionella cerebrum TaxID=2873325 RepID=A0A553QJH9_9TELE|nr:hypothetical protein DNTS_031591 [Danionella translucida]